MGGPQDVDDRQGMTFETDLAALKPVCGWRLSCRATIPICAARPAWRLPPRSPRILLC